MTKYEITFLRGRKTGSHIEIVETISAEDSEAAVDKAIARAKEAGWHVDRVKQID